MTGNYIHVLLDKNPGGTEGQEICGGCKLTLPDDLVGWEEFLNGEYVPEPPNAEGYYPVLILPKGYRRGEVVLVEHEVLYARPALRRRDLFVWSDPKQGARIEKRWSVPLPKMTCSLNNPLWRKVL